MPNINRESFLIYTGLKYFLKISDFGTENFLKSGPTILYYNHSNNIMDFILVLAQCPRQLIFL
jgi:hypothetical protein